MRAKTKLPFSVHIVAPDNVKRKRRAPFRIALLFVFCASIFSQTTLAKSQPTFSRVLSTYPSDASRCDGVEANIDGQKGEYVFVSGTIYYESGQPVYKCLGTKVTVKKKVTLDGKTYSPGTKLTVDRNLKWISVTSWE